MNDTLKKSSENLTDSGEYPLEQLYFYLTEGCNLACRHCWLAPEFDPNGDKRPVLPLEQFKQVVEEAKGLGLNGVKLTGGEPLLHPDFLAILDFIKQNELGLNLETNGILCSDKIAQSIAQLKNVSVAVSLDGADAETHDRVRGVRGAFRKTTSAIRCLAENNLNPQVIMSVMQSNADKVEAIIALAEELGAGSVKFNVIQPTGRGEHVYSSYSGLAVKDLITLGRKVETELAAKTSLELHFDYPAAFRSLSVFASGDGCSVCSILSILGVLPTGKYALCGIGAHVHELTFGSIGQDSLYDVWKNHPVLNDLRSGLPDNLTGICKRCLMKHYCLGSCIAQNYYRKGSLWAPYWFCEQADAAGLFPDSRLDSAFKKVEKML